jgi:ubiquinone/menaquinone biosynthesis C-methylase UbiE
MKPPATFWDRIATRYSKKPVPDEAVYQRKLEVTRGYLRPDMEVLEFGCGTGSTALAHAPFVGHILATDISEKMLEIARGKAADAAVDNVTFRQATLDEVDAPDGSFDAVLGLSILHLLEDKEAAIARVRQLLKPGGVFVTSTVCAGDTMRWIKLILPVGRRLGLMPYVAVFTADELVASLTESGFEIDHRWQPGRGKALFLVARKPG